MRGGLPALLALLLGACATTHAGSSVPLRAGGPPPVSLAPAHREPELVGVRHTVVAGETVYRISRAYGLTPAELMDANGISDPRQLAVGQVLVVPGVERRVPVPALAEVADPSESSMRARGAAGSRSAQAAGRSALRATRPGSLRPEPATRGTLDWPLRGVLYGRFGKKGREPHDGIDLAAPSGTPVRTAAPGEVLYAGEQRGYGNIVIVKHAGDLVTLYAHNRDLRVRTGQQVRAGQVIATVGESGKTSGPHLHFEVRVDGRPVDPLDYLGARTTR